jgi:hypothetical protein
MSNTSFNSRFSNKRKNPVTRLDDIKLDDIKFGVPTKKGPATYIPVTYKGKPLKFQARGVGIGFVGHSTKPEVKETPLLDRNFYFSINAEIEECPDMPGGLCDGPKLHRFHKAIEKKFQKFIRSDKEIANKMKATYKAKDDKGKPKTQLKTLIPLWSDKTPIYDEHGKETENFYPPSVMYKLRPSTSGDNKTKIDSFTTTFKDRRGRELPITPSTVNGSIPRGSFGILDIAMPRIWIGSKELKFTVYLNEAKLVINQTEEETDDFVNVEEDPDDFKEENNDDDESPDDIQDDIDDPDGELAALDDEIEDLP